MGTIMRSFFLLLLSISPLWTIKAHAIPNDKPLVLATSWGETLALDGTGFYNEISADILGRVEDGAQYTIMPYKRAKSLFFKSGTNCLYPSSIEALQSGKAITEAQASNLIESKGLFSARTHIFVKDGEVPPSDFADLAGKRIAFPYGSITEKLLENSGAMLIGVSDENDKAEMLRSGRVNMITGMIPDTALVFNKPGKKMPAFDPSFILFEVELTFVCHNTVKNARFIEKLNKALSDLAKDADYIERLENAYIVTDKLKSIQ